MIYYSREVISHKKILWVSLSYSLYYLHVQGRPDLRSYREIRLHCLEVKVCLLTVKGMAREGKGELLSKSCFRSAIIYRQA